MIIQAVNCYLMASAGGPAPSSDTSVEVQGSVDGSNDSEVVSVHVWRGVDQTTPVDVATTTATGINWGRPNPPAITPITAGAIVVACGLGANPSNAGVFTTTDLSNFATVRESAPFYKSIVGMGSAAWTSGALDPAAFSGGSNSSGASWCAATMALRPAAGESLQFVGMATATRSGATGAWSVSLESLTGGIASAPAVGDVIIVCYGIASPANDTLGVNTAGYTELVELHSDDSTDTNLSLNWKIAA